MTMSLNGVTPPHLPRLMWHLTEGNGTCCQVVSIQIYLVWSCLCPTIRNITGVSTKNNWTSYVRTYVYIYICTHMYIWYMSICVYTCGLQQGRKQLTNLIMTFGYLSYTHIYIYIHTIIISYYRPHIENYIYIVYDQGYTNQHHRIFDTIFGCVSLSHTISHMDSPYVISHMITLVGVSENGYPIDAGEGCRRVVRQWRLHQIATEGQT